MRVLVNGTRDAKVSIILQLHKKNWHKSAEDIKEVLEKAGIPNRTRALVDEAVKLCVECRRHQRILATPKVALRFVLQFNYEVHIDILFVDDWVSLGPSAPPPRDESRPTVNMQ